MTGRPQASSPPSYPPPPASLRYSTRKVSLVGTTSPHLSADLSLDAWAAHNNYPFVTGLANVGLLSQSGCLASVSVLKGNLGSAPARAVGVCPARKDEEHSFSSALAAGSAPKRPQADGSGLREEEGAPETDYCGVEGADPESAEGVGCVDGQPIWWD